MLMYTLEGVGSDVNFISICARGHVFFVSEGNPLDFLFYGV